MISEITLIKCLVSQLSFHKRMNINNYYNFYFVDKINCQNSLYNDLINIL